MGNCRKLLLAKPRGFCAGVRRALDTVERVLSVYGEPICVLHEIVHNEYVVDSLKARGVVFIERVADAVPGKPLIFSAHGVPLDTERQAEQLGLKTVDATCPLVKRIHHQATLFEQEEYHIVLIGHPEHPEIVGTLGRLNHRASVVETVAEARALKLPAEGRVAFLTQTTLSCHDVRDIVAELRKTCPGIRGSDNICYATRNRQAVVEELAMLCDTVFVIGSEKSSNSKRLREIAAGSCQNVFLVRDCRGIPPAALAGALSVGITAAASAPEELVEEMIAFLRGKGWPEPEEIGDVEEQTCFEMVELCS